MREKLHKILDLALDLNKNGYEVFVDVSGHVEAVYVRVYKPKFEEGKNLLYATHAYYQRIDRLYNDSTLDEIIETFERLKGEAK